MKIIQINKYLLYANLFFLQSYLIKFWIGPDYPSNLQETLIFAQIIIFGIITLKSKTLKSTFKNLKKYRVINSLILLTLISILLVPIFDKLYFLRHLKFLFFASTLGYIFLETFKEQKERHKALEIAGYGAVAFGIFSVIYNLLGLNVTHDMRLLGPLDAAVYLAYYLAPFFIFFTTKYIEKPNRKYLASAIILGLLILATRSMGAIGGTFLVMLIYLYKRHKFSAKQTRKVKIGLAVASLLLIVVIFVSKVLPAIQTNYSSLDERGEIYATSMHLLKSPKNILFGVGYGQFQYHYFQNVDKSLGHIPLDYYVLQPHNILLLFLFQYGLLGLLFIGFVIYKTVKRIDNPENITAYMLSYFFIHGLIDTPYFKNDLMILMIILMEVALASNYSKPATKSIKTA